MTMSAKTRIYAVNSNGGETVALVRAKSRAQALAHHARRSFTASLPSQDDLFSAAADGLQIEEANNLDDDAA